MSNARKNAQRYVAQNRRARHDYFIEDSLEAGMVLQGSEVKSLRNGQASLAEAYAVERQGELYLINAHINEYAAANRFNHEPRRARKILVHRRELAKLLGARSRDGITLVPLSIYFNARGYAKLELGIAKGKKKVDKRETLKERDWKRDKQRALKQKDY